ncbi:MAG: Amidohydrolase 3 [Mycobacterium sp.]|nr:Amidohydrolase 3 [Mycobacterium sp.]
MIRGTVLTVDDRRPTAEAVAAKDGRIVAVGDRPNVENWVGPGTQVLDIGDGCVMPGLIEAHGHPLMEAVVLSDRMVDIRPVTMRNPNDVMGAVRWEVARRGAAGAYLTGWDPLLQVGLPESARRRTRRHLQPVRRPDSLLGGHPRRRNLRGRARIALDGCGLRCRCRGAHLTAQRPAGHLEEPLRNISVAVTRTAPSGRVLAPEERLTVDQAIRAQTTRRASCSPTI